MGVDDNLYAWIESFLKDRLQRVAINSSYSTWTKVKSGVPQGSVIGPILFIIYINDLPEAIKSTCSIFADDTKIMHKVCTPQDSEELQEDLNKLTEWTKTWMLYFNVKKCKVIHFGPKNCCYDYQLNGQTLTKVETEKDLGIIISHDLKIKENVAYHVKKANKMLGLIRRTFSFLNKDSFLALYKAYVRPQLEYCQQACHPYLIKDIEELENVQRRATKLVQSIEHLSYEERMKELDLFSLKHRRQRGDMIMVYKILHGFIKIDMSDLFQYNLSGKTRGHNYKLQVPGPIKTDIRRDSFSQRIILPWNGLPCNIVNSQTTQAFKREYDKHHILLHSK